VISCIYNLFGLFWSALIVANAVDTEFNMKILTTKEAEFVSGGDGLVCSSGSGNEISWAYCAYGSNSVVITVTPNENSTVTVNEIFTWDGGSQTIRQNSGEQLAGGFFGLGVGLMILPLGLSATGMAMAMFVAKQGLIELMHSKSYEDAN
jgi:hypothetical protein